MSLTNIDINHNTNYQLVEGSAFCGFRNRGVEYRQYTFAYASISFFDHFDQSLALGKCKYSNNSTPNIIARQNCTWEESSETTLKEDNSSDDMIGHCVLVQSLRNPLN